MGVRCGGGAGAPSPFCWAALSAVPLAGALPLGCCLSCSILADSRARSSGGRFRGCVSTSCACFLGAVFFLTSLTTFGLGADFFSGERDRKRAEAGEDDGRGSELLLSGRRALSVALLLSLSFGADDGDEELRTNISLHCDTDSRPSTLPGTRNLVLVLFRWLLEDSIPPTSPLLSTCNTITCFHNLHFPCNLNNTDRILLLLSTAYVLKYRHRSHP